MKQMKSKMNRRNFITASGIAALGSTSMPLIAGERKSGSLSEKPALKV